MNESSIAPTAATALALALCACGDDYTQVGPLSGQAMQPLTVEVSLRQGERTVGCGDVLTSVGTTQSEVELRDARVFLHDLQVELRDGRLVPWELTTNQWQRSGVALLDFADDTGLCETGSPEVNRQLTGQYASDQDAVGIRFRVGLPRELNHLDSARAPAPLNAAGMAWSWVGGYKYARIDARTTGNEFWYIHLGATGCEGSPAEGIECNFANLATIAVRGLDPDQPQMALDLDRLYQGSDLDAPLDEENDSVPGCMAFGGDPQCDAVFAAFGMGFESDTVSDTSCFTAVGAAQ